MIRALSMRWCFAGLLVSIAAISYDLGRSAPQLLNAHPPTYSQLPQ